MNARITILCLVTLLLPLTAAAEDDPLAVLMARQGEVTVMRGGDELGASFGMHLDQGDEIRTGANSSADIVFATGQALQLGANGRLVVQGSADQESGGTSPEVFGSTQQIITVRGPRGASGIGNVRSAGTTEEMIAVAPRIAARPGTEPVFEWSGGSGEVELTLTRDGAVIWTATATDAQSIPYPADAPDLAAGAQYAWFVKVSDPLALSPAQSQTAFFEVLSAESQAELEETLESIEGTPVSVKTRAMLAAGVLFDYGLIHEAVATIDGTLAESGDDPDLAEVRDNLLAASWP